MTETPMDVLNHRLGKLRDNGDIDFDNTAIAVDIDAELQRKFIFIPRAEVDAVEIDTNPDGLHHYQAGSGPETIRAHKDDNPAWLHNSAINALAMCQFLMREQDRKANEERLAKRPEPGVYQAQPSRVNSGGHFIVIVTEDRKVIVPQNYGGVGDYTRIWDENPTMWALTRIDITDGTVQS